MLYKKYDSQALKDDYYVKISDEAIEKSNHNGITYFSN